MPDVSGTLARRSLLTGIVALAGAALFPRDAAADSARPGPWCRDLSKAARRDAFDITAELLDGGGAAFRMSDHLGTPVWVQFFTTWCPPCNAGAGTLVRIAEKYHDAVVTIGIDVGEPAATVRKFRERHGVTYPIALDESSAIFKGLGLRGYPTHVFFDANAMVSCLSVGDMTPSQCENELAVALARPRLPTPHPSP